jgi:putative oxidoreductase
LLGDFAENKTLIDMQFNATNIVSWLLGLIFLVFGLNGFLQFLPMPPMNEDAGVFLGSLMKSGWLPIVKVLEVVLGAMIIFNFKRPLALVLLAPIVVCILLFHLLIAGEPIMAIVLTGLLGFLLWSYRDRYAGMLA